MVKKQFPYFKFIETYFPDKCPKKKFDMVTMFATFPQLPNWKEILLEMVKHSKKYINLTLPVRLSGTTVVDKDVSYFYYLDSGLRVHQVVHNLYELINFCSIHEMRAKNIYFTVITSYKMAIITAVYQTKNKLEEIFSWNYFLAINNIRAEWEALQKIFSKKLTYNFSPHQSKYLLTVSLLTLIDFG